MEVVGVSPVLSRSLGLHAIFLHVSTVNHYDWGHTWAFPGGLHPNKNIFLLLFCLLEQRQEICKGSAHMLLRQGLHTTYELKLDLINSRKPHILTYFVLWWSQLSNLIFKMFKNSLCKTNICDTETNVDGWRNNYKAICVPTPLHNDLCNILNPGLPLEMLTCFWKYPELIQPREVWSLNSKSLHLSSDCDLISLEEREAAQGGRGEHRGRGNRRNRNVFVSFCRNPELT